MEKCLPCQEKPGKCLRQGALYTLECSQCKEEKKRSLYYGETARTPYDRGLNHGEAIRRGDPNHPIVAHYLEDHPGLEPSCGMKVIGFQEKNVYRQAKEGCLIADFSGDKLLNSRGDWGQNLPPRLEVEGKRPPPSPPRRQDRRNGGEGDRGNIPPLLGAWRQEKGEERAWRDRRGRKPPPQFMRGLS